MCGGPLSYRLLTFGQVRILCGPTAGNLSQQDGQLVQLGEAARQAHGNERSFDNYSVYGLAFISSISENLCLLFSHICCLSVVYLLYNRGAWVLLVAISTGVGQKLFAEFVALMYSLPQLLLNDERLLQELRTERQGF